MSVAPDFRSAYGQAQRRLPGPDLKPSALAMAARDVLFVDGVSLSASEGEFRVPLGASDDAALVAENLQFTAGDGPCLTAIGSGAVIDAPLPILRRRWPALADLMLTRTDFRSAFSYPLMTRPDGGVAMNLFLNSGEGATQARMTDVAEVGTLIVRELFPDHPYAGDGEEPLRQGFAGALSRHQVWVAIGLLSVEDGLSIEDALARLRSYAYANGTTVDETAAWLVREPQRITALRP